MSYIVDVKTNFPKNKATQEEIKNLLGTMWPNKKNHIDQFAKNATVLSRNLSLPLSEYTDLGDFGKRNQNWTEVAFELQTKNLESIMRENNLRGNDVDAIISTTVTGLCIPTLESRLMNRFNLNPKIKRMPLFGLGCLGGVAGINRAHDYLKGHPNEAVILMATELCTLTFQFDDQSVANLVGTSLFADGSAMVLMCGDQHPLRSRAKFEILDTASFFYPNTERIMGWEIVANGFQIVLSGDVPKIVRENVKDNMQEFLAEKKYSQSDIQFFISHPGGPKVLEALASVTERTSETFSLSWDSLRDNGNMSSVSVLHVMEKTLQEKIPSSGKIGMMLAMGPAFASEFNLIKKV